MAISTYAELQTALTNWTGRSDITSRSPEWIAMAEAAFNRGFSESQPFRAFDQEASTTVALSEYTALPTDCLELRGVKGTWSPIRKLIFAVPEVLDLSYTTGTAGYPVLFALEAGQLRVRPPPSAGLSVKLLYYQKVPALTVSATTNWLLTAHPDIYLFGALLHGGVYGKDDPQLNRVVSGYNAAVNGLRAVTKRVRFAGGSLQMVAA